MIEMYLLAAASQFHALQRSSGYWKGPPHLTRGLKMDLIMSCFSRIRCLNGICFYGRILKMIRFFCSAVLFCLLSWSSTLLLNKGCVVLIRSSTRRHASWWPFQRKLQFFSFNSQTYLLWRKYFVWFWYLSLNSYAVIPIYCFVIWSSVVRVISAW